MVAEKNRKEVNVTNTMQ